MRLQTLSFPTSSGWGILRSTVFFFLFLTVSTRSMSETGVGIQTKPNLPTPGLNRFGGSARSWRLPPLSLAEIPATRSYTKKKILAEYERAHARAYVTSSPLPCSPRISHWFLRTSRASSCSLPRLVRGEDCGLRLVNVSASPSRSLAGAGCA